MANPHGTPTALELHRDGNTSALKHGAYSRRALDRLVAEDIGALQARTEALGAELDRRGVRGQWAGAEIPPRRERPSR